MELTWDKTKAGSFCNDRARQSRNMNRPNIFERAFEIAPDCHSLMELKARLNREGYAQVDAHFDGRQIKGEIRQLLASGRLTAADGQYCKTRKAGSAES